MKDTQQLHFLMITLRSHTPDHAASLVWLAFAMRNQRPELRWNGETRRPQGFSLSQYCAWNIGTWRGSEFLKD